MTKKLMTIITDTDTIAAISTPVSAGGIGIIRLSGKDSADIARKIFRRQRNENGQEDLHLKSHTITYGFIFDGKQYIDEVLLTYMKAPRSYTTEDVIEINCHSGVLVLKNIMELVLKNGARNAEAGEFTKRAFLNGRIDLTRAEAVIDIINAKTDGARKAASNQLYGALYDAISQMMEQLLMCISSIEVDIDYPEHEEDTVTNVGAEVRRLISDAQKIYDTADYGIVRRDGANTVIIGKTNVGKSSLLNYFTKTDRAIVTDIHGTTRDTVTESVNIGGVLLILTDTAGIRQTNDKVERIGIDKAKAAATAADLILYVFDATDVDLGLEIETETDISQYSGETCKTCKKLALVNKCDLGVSLDISKLHEKFGADNVFELSVKDKIGLDKVEQKIKSLFEGVGADNALITNLRQKDALTRAITSLRAAEKSMDDGFSVDIVSIDLMDAYSHLGEITGATVQEDVAAKIFERFCVGK